MQAKMMRRFGVHVRPSKVVWKVMRSPRLLWESALLKMGSVMALVHGLLKAEERV
jgi:hypothetical protein